MSRLLFLSQAFVLVLVHGDRLIRDALLALLEIRKLGNAVAVSAIKDAERTLSDRVTMVATTLGDVLRWAIRALVRSIFLPAQYFGLLLWHNRCTIVPLLLLRLLHMAQKVLLLLNLRKLFGHVALGEVLGELLLKIVDSLFSQLASKGTLPTCVVGHS